MSDLAATSCGCNSCDGGNGCSCIIWIILILFCCGGNNGFGGFGNSCGGDDCGCIIWILLILFLCGGNGFGCGGNSCC